MKPRSYAPQHAHEAAPRNCASPRSGSTRRSNGCFRPVTSEGGWTARDECRVL